MKSSKQIIFILSALLCFCIVTSQTQEDRKYIIEHSNISALVKLKNKLDKEYDATINKAKTKKFLLNKYSKSKNKIGVLSKIEKGVPYYDFDDNESAAIASGINEIWSGSSLNLTGNNIVIGHWEAGGVPLFFHQELNGRINILEASGASDHATHTAGTMIGSGINSSAKGMATGATIEARRSDNDETEMIAFAANGGILSNHSYSSDDPESDTKFYGYYSQIASDWDEIANNAPYYTICKSAGNDRNDGFNMLDSGYDIMYSQTLSKNVITIGAVEDIVNYVDPSSVVITNFSSFGPTDDWRIKPDVVVNGATVFSSESGGINAYGSQSGTSQASAVVSGTIALLQEHYKNINGVYMKSATVKALLTSTTDEAGSNLGPDFSFGWGLLNAERAAQVISNNQSSSEILEGSLANNQSIQLSITVDGTKPLVLSMAWSDIPGTPIPLATFVEDQDDLMLVNDLDVKITGGGNTYMPWMIPTGSFTNAATKGDNFRDNVERIDVGSIPAGTYTVTISHKGQLFNNANQDFSIVINNITSATLSSSPNKVVSENIKIYPNPVNQEGILHVSIPQNLLVDTEIKIFDIYGKPILKNTYGVNNIDIDVSKLSSGVYLMEINNSDVRQTNKIIIN